MLFRSGGGGVLSGCCGRLCTYLLYVWISCDDKVDDAFVYHVYVWNFSMGRGTFISSIYLKLVLLHVHFTVASVVVWLDRFCYLHRW